MATEVSNSVEQGQGKISHEIQKDSDESKRAAVERQNVTTQDNKNVEANVALFEIRC